MNNRLFRIIIAFFIILSAHVFLFVLHYKHADLLTVSSSLIAYQTSDEFRIELIKIEKPQQKTIKVASQDPLVFEEELNTEKEALSKDLMTQDASSVYDKQVLSYQIQVLTAIEKNKHYPKQEKNRGHEGRVTVGFVIFRDGNMQDLSVLNSSNYDQLDKAALDSVMKASPFQVFPKNLTDDQLFFNIHIDFIL